MQRVFIKLYKTRYDSIFSHERFENQTNFNKICLKLINCLENCYSETLPEIHHTINSYSEKQRNRFKNAGISILFKKFYNFLSATDQLSRKLLFWNSARDTPHYKQLFRETEKQIENWYKTQQFECCNLIGWRLNILSVTEYHMLVIL